MTRKKPSPSTAHQQLASVVESTAEAIISRSLDGTILTWNAGAERLYGYQADEVIGKPVSILVPENIPRDDLEITKQIGRGERIGRYITLRRRKDGGTVMVELAVSPLKDSRGGVIAVATVCRDITAQESVMSRQREFVSIASHELRTPLTALTGYLSLATGTDDASQSRVFVDRAYKAARRLTDLVEDLLQVARLEEDRASFAITTVHPDEVVCESVEELRSQAEHKKIRVSVHSELTKRDAIRVDRTRFHQVLRNILDNAVKYTPSGGRVSVRSTVRDSGIRIRIRDSGIGIDPQNLNKIFEKFFREYTELSVSAGGTGLGMFITKQLVERQGGSLQVRSRRNAGTTVTVTFPRAPRPKSVSRGATMQKKK